MNYAKYPIPIWTSFLNWQRVIKNTPTHAEAIIRDNYKCIDCGIGNIKLIVHHIDESGSDKKPNENLTNLATLCVSCHTKRHGFVKKGRLLDELEAYSDKEKNLPNGVLTAIGYKFALSRERVRQIAKKEGYIMPHDEKNKYLQSSCVICGKSFKTSRAHKQSCCSQECYKEFYRKRIANYYAIKNCEQCGKQIKFYKKLITYGRAPRFCGKRCQGRWLGNHYGWKFGTSNASLHPSSEVVAQDFPEGFTIEEFAKKYGYKTRVTAGVAISNLVFREEAEHYRVRGLYRIKTKLPR